jgi:sulfatase maturation enzyme AslB (radical SAM superfamily)
MGTLIVHNHKNIESVTEIEVVKNNVSIKKLSGLNILHGSSSDAVTLPDGHYTVNVTVKSPNECVHEPFEADVYEGKRTEITIGLPPGTPAVSLFPITCEVDSNLVLSDRRFSPCICITHNCNLDCVYCYQKHSATERMSPDTARKAIDWIFAHIPQDLDAVEIGFIGGEPLLEFPLIKEIVTYTCSKKREKPYIFFATTNGTAITEEMKEWFTDHKGCFVLGLSLDGRKDTHDHNRSNSFDKIDIDFFRKNWSKQGLKMTLSEYSLAHLADDIKYLHSLDFGSIDGVNPAEGNFDWSKDEYIKILIPQLAELVNFYVEHADITPNMMFSRQLELCEGKTKSKKWCGIGTGTPFFDVDGKRFPCSYITPMTFSQAELNDILRTDFSNEDNFVDEDCYKNCYIYPVCPTCSGSNYMVNKTFKERDKKKCRIQKLIALFSADLQAKRIAKNPKRYDDKTLYFTIAAIKKIRELYLPEFEPFF